MTVIPFDTSAQPVVIAETKPERVVVPVPAADAPAIVRSLADFEIAGDYAAALKATLRDVADLSESDREKLVAWLEARKDSTAFPTLFMLARTHQDAGRGEDAAKWYMAGSLMGLIDAARFGDGSASNAVREVEAQFSDIRQRLRQDSTPRLQAATFSLEIEEQLASRQAPLWIAARVQSAVAGDPTPLLAPADWEAKGKNYHDMFRGFVERAGKMSVVELVWDF